MTNLFIFESPLILEETFYDHITVEATLLTEGLSKHNKLYTVDDTNFKLVAETALNKPIYYGQDVFGQHYAPPIFGKWSQEHLGDGSEDAKPVGKIIESWFDDKTRRVKAKLRIWQSDLMRRLRGGFKISVRGLFDDFKNVVYQGKNAMKVIGLRIKDIQILEPEVRIGVEGAKVEKVLEESMEFFSSEDNEDVAIISGLIEGGFIKYE